MKKLRILTIALFCIAGSFAVNAQDWEIDYVHSSVTFSITHFFTPVAGRFEKFEGILTFNPDEPANSKINFTVTVESVNTDQERRDKDLVSDNFFDAQTYPSMRFVSSKVEKLEGNNYNAHGKLTIKDVTKDVVIPFTILGRGDHPMKKGSEIMGLKAEFKLNRNDYNVGKGNWAATAVVGNEVSAIVSLEASKKK
jgi:polyisoprenoid-binding protein YceI